MTADGKQSDGTLVVDATGGLSWWSHEVPAVAMVDLAIGEGVSVQVDAASPSSVLAWVCLPGGDVDALGAAMADNGFASRLADLRKKGESFSVEGGPTLADTWSRRALVSAVSRWSLRSLHEGALILDEAASEYRAGNEPAAARLFTLGASSLLALGEDCAEGDVVAGPAIEVVEILRIAGEAVAGSKLGDAALELAARCGEPTSFADDELREILAEWDLAAAESQYTAVHYGEGQASDLRIDTGFIDVQAIPPRIIAWEGADVPDLIIEYQSGKDSVLITATLAGGVDPFSLEVQQLLAYSSDADTGMLAASAPMAVNGRTLAASLPCSGRDPDEFHFGVFYADTDVRALRTGRAGRLLIEVDRLMVDSWNHQRAGISALYTVDASSNGTKFDDAQRIFRDQIRLAGDLASEAEGRLDRILDSFSETNESDEDPTARLIRAKIDAISRYLEQLDVLDSAPRSMHPLLAEMLPNEAWEEDEDI